MFTITEIKNLSRTPVLLQAGVYFLIHKETITYVGQSSNIQLRMGQHRSDPTKVFDSYAWIPVKGRLNRLKVEAEYIAYIKTCKQPINLQNKTLP